MEWFPQSKDHLPLTWWKGNPVYLAAVIALGGVASMVLTAVLMGANPGWLMPLIFSVNHLRYGWLWTPVTYVLINPPDIWFLLTSYMLYSFGEAIERHLGRWSFVKLILGLVLVTPLLLLIVSVLGPSNWPAAGMRELEFGVFLAFAALYPTARVSIIVVTLEVRVLAVAFVAIDALMDLASQNWAGLFILAGQVGMAVGYIRYEQGLLQLPKFNWPRRKPLRSVPKQRVQPVVRPAPVAKSSGLEDVDDILEKISRQGLASLTDEERRVLEKASEHLSKRGPKR